MNSLFHLQRAEGLSAREHTTILLFVGAIGVALTAFLAMLFPLAVYSLSLAVFGLPHVFAELRYVDLRFSRRIAPSSAIALFSLLGLVALLRLLDLQPGVLPFARTSAELWILLALVLVMSPTLRHSGQSGALVALSSIAIAAGIVLAPAATLVVLAFLHNLTPLGFLAERLQGAERRPALLASLVAFLIVPLAIILGFDGTASAEWAGLASGGVNENASVFVPEFLLESSRAPALFAAAAYLQVLHYFVVLHVLPKLVDATAARRTWVAWPKPKAFALWITFTGLLFFVGFLVDFGETRKVYGIFAVVHAFLEIPILLFALDTKSRCSE